MSFRIQSFSGNVASLRLSIKGNPRPQGGRPPMRRNMRPPNMRPAGRPQGNPRPPSGRDRFTFRNINTA